MRLRENKVDIAGRSLILNIVAILLNIIGVFYIAKGFHMSSGENGMVFKIIGFSTFFIGLIMLYILKGMHMFSFVARAFVGGLFIVSGLVKANDPWGFAFKLEEYFSPMGLSYDYSFFEMFRGFELELSIVICIAEIVLGVAVILGYRIKLASWALILMMIGFTWLTYYTYSCVDANELLTSLGQVAERDCVTDCGCFGDALRGSVGRSLTPYESFWKDIILFYFVIIIFINQRKIKPNNQIQNWVMVPSALIVVIFFSWVFGWYFPIFFYLTALLGSFIFAKMNIGKLDASWKIAMYVTVLSFLFSLYATMYLPVKDYRAYAIGNNIHEKMSDGINPIVDYVFVYKNKQTGQEQEFGMDELDKCSDTEVWEYVDRKDKIISMGKQASISDFLLTIDYEELTDEMKKFPTIDSIIQYDLPSYYEEIVKIEVNGQQSEIPSYEFQPYYLDSIVGGFDTTYVKKLDTYSKLMDSETRFKVDVTEYILSLDKVLLMTIRDIDSYNEAAIEDLKKVYEQAKEEGVPFYILTPATQEKINEFKKKYNFNAPYLTMDGTEIKIIVRSNPGLVLMKKATIIDKWASRSIPDFDYIQDNYLKD
jgi:uncharacterized membrane protein YphA (DoxX/SURF4 family)